MNRAGEWSVSEENGAQWAQSLCQWSRAVSMVP